jgi:hypothetical protein
MRAPMSAQSEGVAPHYNYVGAVVTLVSKVTDSFGGLKQTSHICLRTFILCPPLLPVVRQSN